MYGPIDFQVAEAIIQAIGRKQAEAEAQQEAQPMPPPSLLARIVSRLTARESYADAARGMPESDPSLACE